MRHGRTFIQHMRDLLTSHYNCSTPDDTAVVPVTPDMRDDLRWWQNYVSQWNGVSLL